MVSIYFRECCTAVIEVFEICWFVYTININRSNMVNRWTLCPFNLNIFACSWNLRRRNSVFTVAAVSINSYSIVTLRWTAAECRKLFNIYDNLMILSNLSEADKFSVKILRTSLNIVWINIRILFFVSLNGFLIWKIDGLIHLNAYNTIVFRNIPIN